MAVIKLRHIVQVGDDGSVELNEPTAEQWQKYNANRWPLGRDNRPVNNVHAARVELFDEIFHQFNNCWIETSDGDTRALRGRDDLLHFPARWKDEAIAQQFDNEVDVAQLLGQAPAKEGDETEKNLSGTSGG